MNSESDGLSKQQRGIIITLWLWLMNMQHWKWRTTMFIFSFDEKLNCIEIYFISSQIFETDNYKR